MTINKSARLVKSVPFGPGRTVDAAVSTITQPFGFRN
jgi:hypothetical protein